MRKCFYQLDYVYRDINHDTHSLGIGYFSDIKKVRLAIKSIEGKPGFINTIGNFEITRFYVDFIDNGIIKSGVKLYEVSHEYLDENGYDNFTIFGIYATYEEAQRLLLQKIRRPPFNEYPDGFCISSLTVDLYEWKDGFTLWQ